MAGKGTYTALQRLKPIEADFGKIAKDEEESNIKALDKRQAKKDAEKAAKDKISFDPQGNILTGIDSLDLALYNGISKVSKNQYESYKKARNNPSYANSDEYKLKNKNRNNFSKNLKVFTDQYKEFADKITAMGGDLAGWNEDIREQIGGFFVKERVEFTENEFGEPVASIALHDPESDDGYKRDANGEVVTKTVGLPEVLKGLGDYHIVPKVNVTEMAQSIGEKFGKEVTTQRNGFTITEEQLWENKKADALEAVKGQLGSVKNPTDLAKRLWGDKDGRSKDDWGEEALETVAQEYLQLVKPYYDQTRKLSYNYAGLNAEIGRKAESNKGAITPAITVDSDSGEPKVVNIPNQNKPGYAISFGTGVQMEKAEARTSVVTNVYVTEDGEFYADKTIAVRKIGGSAEGGEADKSDAASIFLMGGKKAGASQPKGWEMQDEIGVELTETELTNIVKNPKVEKKDGSPYLNTKEFKDDMKEQYNNSPKKGANDFNKAAKNGGGASKFNKK